MGGMPGGMGGFPGGMGGGGGGFSGEPEEVGDDLPDLEEVDEVD